MTKRIKEDFFPGHARMTDQELLAPRNPPFTPMNMFVCTYEVRLGGMNFPFETFVERVQPREPVVALNSNFGHKALPGHEHHLKAPKEAEEAKDPAPAARRPGRPPQAGAERRPRRKVQGDGTCFNSTVEPVVVHPDYLGPRGEKVYKVKCFPTTGCTQIPGVRCADYADGMAVAHAWVQYVNEELRPEIAVTIESSRAIMLNFNFALRRSSPRILLDLEALKGFLQNQDAGRAPPYRVREVKYATDDDKLSFKMEVGARNVRVNVFLRGKINILGAETHESAKHIYDYLSDTLSDGWETFVCLKPRPDREVTEERKRNAAAPAAVMIEPASSTTVDPPPSADEILDDLLEGLEESQRSATATGVAATAAV